GNGEGAALAHGQKPTRAVVAHAREQDTDGIAAECAGRGMKENVDRRTVVAKRWSVVDRDASECRELHMELVRRDVKIAWLESRAVLRQLSFDSQALVQPVDE